MKENQSANFGPRLPNGRMYSSKPLKNKLKSNRYFGVKNVSLNLRPENRPSSFSTRTGSLGNNRASSRRYEKLPSDTLLSANQSYSELPDSSSTTPLMLFDPQEFINQSQARAQPQVKPTGPRPPYPQQTAPQSHVSPSPIPSITSPEGQFYSQAFAGCKNVQNRANCFSSCSDLNDKQFQHVAQIPGNRMPRSQIEAVHSLAQRNNSQATLTHYESLASLMSHPQHSRRPSTTKHQPHPKFFKNASQVLSPSELSIRTGASLAINDLSVGVPPRSVQTSRGPSRSHNCFSSMSSSYLGSSKHGSRQSSRDRLKATVSMDQCKKKLNPSNMREGAFSRVHQIIYNSKHKKQQPQTRQAPRRQASLSVNIQQIERATKRSQFINRRQTLQDKQDTFNLSTGSSAFNTDHFYSARLPATTSHQDSQSHFNTLAAPELAAKLPVKTIQLPLQSTEPIMVHSMVAGPHSPCKSVEIVNSMLMNSHHLSNLEKENAAPPRTEVMQYSRDIDTKDSPGIPSISVNNSNTPSEPETELTFPMSRKAAVKDVSTSINMKDMELYISRAGALIASSENTPSFPGMAKNKVLLDHQTSVQESRPLMLAADSLTASFSGSGVQQPKSKRNSLGGIQNVSMSSHNPLENSWKMGTFSDLELLSMSPPTDKLELPSASPAQISEQYETAKKDFAKVLGSQVKYYTLNLASGRSSHSANGMIGGGDEQQQQTHSYPDLGRATFGRPMGDVPPPARSQDTLVGYLRKTEDSKIEEATIEDASNLEETEERKEGGGAAGGLEARYVEQESQSQNETSRKSFEIKDISRFLAASRTEEEYPSASGRGGEGGSDFLERIAIDESQLAPYLNQPLPANISINDSSSGDLGEVTQNLTQRFNQSLSPGSSPIYENCRFEVQALERYMAATSTAGKEQENTTLVLTRCIGSPREGGGVYFSDECLLPTAAECVDGVQLLEASSLDHFQNSLSTINEQNSLLSSLRLTGPYVRPEGGLGGTGGGSEFFGGSGRLTSARGLQSSVEILSRIQRQREIEESSLDLHSSIKNFSISPILTEDSAAKK